MKKITSFEAAKRLNVTPRRVQQMCKNGEFEDAEKIGKSWYINIAIPELELREREIKFVPVPIGISDYIEASQYYYYVDKTMFIKEIIDNKTKISLITRPRRFGKTLTMDMVRVFFEKTNEDTSIYFKDKLIWKEGKQYQNYQGQYPVIFLTLKDVKCSNWEDTYAMIKKVIALEFQRHEDLEKSSSLSEYEKEEYNKLYREEGSFADYQFALKLLSNLLYKHYKKQCIIIIDEYDTPIQEGYTKGFYNQIIEFMRNLFSAGLKDNNALAFGFLTGILRVAKESIFSGLNNIKISSILDNKYSQYFGFTRKEVDDLLYNYHYDDKMDEVCEWYDGYRFGKTDIFNPWSVLNYIDDRCTPKAFWSSTGSNDIIGEIIANANEEIMNGLHQLLENKTITSYIDTNIVYSDIQKNPYSIYSFLVLSGYLKINKIYPQTDGNYLCEISIPNKEISSIYEKEILSRLGNNSLAISFKQSLFNQDFKKLQKTLEDFLIQSISIYDGTNESFYHGMMLGLCAIVSSEYKICSNKESGLGRFDIQLEPVNYMNPGFIFEFKYTKDENQLKEKAEEALKQIEKKKYDTDMKKNGIKHIFKIGISFSGKKTYIQSNE